MEIYELKNKLIAVWAAARVIVQKYGHTRKFAKHLVALAIRQIENFNDIKLVHFLMNDKIGRILGYKRTLHESTFSKVRERSDPMMFQELITWIIEDRFKGKQISLVAQDSTDVPAYSKDDRDAKIGVRTIPKKRQHKNKEKTEFFHGYKIHTVVEVETELPISIIIDKANHHDSTFFRPFFIHAKQLFTFGFGSKYLADSAMDAAWIKDELKENNTIPVIASNGRRKFKSSIPKDKDYGKRWAVERFFSRLKEKFGLRNNRFIGIKNVKIYVFSCILGYLLSY